MKASDTRKANLLALIQQYGSVVALAEALTTDPSQISQITGGHRTMGPRFAKKIEERLKLEEGWMDTERKPEAPPIPPMDRRERELMEIWRKLPPLIQVHFTALMRQAALPLSPTYIQYEKEQMRRNRLRGKRKKENPER